MLFTTYGITYFWQNANYIRFDPFFDPGLYDQIRSDPLGSGQIRLDLVIVSTNDSGQQFLI